MVEMKRFALSLTLLAKQVHPRLATSPKIDGFFQLYHHEFYNVLELRLVIIYPFVRLVIENERVARGFGAAPNTTSFGDSFAQAGAPRI